jgi:hypothetical protein
MMMHWFVPIFGEEFVIRALKVMKFSVRSLTALGNEMFRLTNETRGGLLLMMIFFYSAFVLGAVVYYTVADEDIANCHSLRDCVYSMMRLTFFDGDGFDLAKDISKQHPILFLVVMMYMCLTSFGLLNGLVGIFGSAFARASQIAFEDDLVLDNGIDTQNDAGNAKVEANRGSSYISSVSDDSYGNVVNYEIEEEESEDVLTDLKRTGNNGAVRLGVTTGGGRLSPGKPSSHASSAAPLSSDHLHNSPNSTAIASSEDNSIELSAVPRRKTLKALIAKHNVGGYGAAKVATEQTTETLPLPFHKKMLSRLQSKSIQPGKLTLADMQHLLKHKKDAAHHRSAVGGLFGASPFAGKTFYNAAPAVAGSASSAVTALLQISVKEMESSIDSLALKVDHQNEQIAKLVKHVENLSQVVNPHH